MNPPVTTLERILRLMLDNKACLAASWEKIDGADQEGICRAAYGCQKYGWFKDMALRDRGVLSYVEGFGHPFKVKVLELVQEKDLQGLANHPDALTMWGPWLEMGLSVGDTQVVDVLWHGDAWQGVKGAVLKDLHKKVQQGQCPIWASWALNSGLVSVAGDMYATLQHMIEPPNPTDTQVAERDLMHQVKAYKEFYGDMVNACERFLHDGGEPSAELYQIMQNVGQYISLAECSLATRAMMDHYALHGSIGDTAHKKATKSKVM